MSNNQEVPHGVLSSDVNIANFGHEMRTGIVIGMRGQTIRLYEAAACKKRPEEVYIPHSRHVWRARKEAPLGIAYWDVPH